MSERSSRTSTQALGPLSCSESYCGELVMVCSAPSTCQQLKRLSSARRPAPSAMREDKRGTRARLGRSGAHIARQTGVGKQQPLEGLIALRGTPKAGLVRRGIYVRVDGQGNEVALMYHSCASRVWAEKVRNSSSFARIWDTGWPGCAVKTVVIR